MFYSFAYFCYLVLIRHGISGAAFRTVTSQLEREAGFLCGVYMIRLRLRGFSAGTRVG